jgi:hypothetical protein
MSSGVAAFPSTLPSGTVVGRVAIGSGPAEAVAIAALWAALNNSSYVGQVISKRKPADESRTSNAVLANDADLSFAIAANEEWIGSFSLLCSDAVVGPKVALTFPVGATLEADGFLATAGSTVFGRSSTSGGTIFNGTGQATDIGLIYFWILNGAAAGTVTLQWAQTTSNGTATTFRKGSFMQATRIG